jgi:hypothetical protein
MKIWTAHTRPGAAPILIKEGFSLGGLVFGPLWLLARGAWIPGALTLVAWVAFALRPAPLGTMLLLALHWGISVFGEDLRRWSLGLRGYVGAHVVAAADEDTALSRLLDRRPDLIAQSVALP